MMCKFEGDKECINSELFDRWKDDKRETAWLALGVCPKCPIFGEMRT